MSARPAIPRSSRARRVGVLAAVVLGAALVLPAHVVAQGNVYLASSFFRQKKYEKVLKVLETLEDPLGPRLLYYKAESLAGLDRRPEAVAAYKELVERFSDHPDAYDARRKVLLLLDQDKNYAAMVEEVRGFRAGDPSGRLPYNRLEADAHFKAGHYDEAIALLETSDEEADQRTLAEILRELGRVESYLGGDPVPPGDFGANRRRALLLEHLRLPVQAAVHYRRALEVRPEDRFSLERLALALEAAGENAEAREVYRKLMGLDAEEVKYGARLGKLLWKDGRKEEAKAVWEQLLGNGSDSQRARLVVRLLLEHGDPVAALEVIERARNATGQVDLLLEEEERAHLANRDPKQAVAVWVRSLLHLGAPARGEIDPRERVLELAAQGGSVAGAAREAVEEAIETYPLFVEYYVLADELLRKLGEEEAIEPLMRRLVRAVGQDPGTLRDHAARFRDQNRYLEASILFEAAHDQLPPQHRWVVALEAAEAFRERGAPAEAREFLEPFFAEGSDADAPPQALLTRAADLDGRILLEDLRRNLEARRHFTRWIPRVSAGSEWVVPWVILAARAAGASGDFAAAEAAYAALLERGGLKEHTAEVHYRLGRLHLFAGKLEEARQILRKVGEEYPDSPLSNDALREVAWLLDHREAGEEELRRFLALRHLVESGRFDDFREALGPREEDSVPPSLRPDYLWAQAQALEAAGEDGVLASVLRSAADEHPDSGLRPRFLSELARVEERRGRLQEAEAAWRAYLLAEPDGLRLEEVRDRLARLKRMRAEARREAPPEP